MIPEPTAEDLARRAVTAERALLKINEIRNSIIGLQTVNWSEHIYPLVCALNEAGINGMGYPEAKSNYGTMLERLVAAERERDELKRWKAKALTLLVKYDAIAESFGGQLGRSKVDILAEGVEGLRAEVELYEAMKSGVTVRISDLEAENENLRAEVERLKMEIAGYQKANDLLLKGMESQADLMDGMKQKLRAGK